MPKASVNREPVRVRLEKAPPDGFVVIRRMSYGELLEQQELVSKMSSSLDNQDGASREVNFDVSILDSQLYSFRKCIVEHNLTDENDNIIDLLKPIGLQMLDPAVGREIADAIDKLNSGEDMTPFLVTSGTLST